jgi:tripartite-type tricarboxylate transporter receptor subunit TctC
VSTRFNLEFRFEQRRRQQVNNRRSFIGGAAALLAISVTGTAQAQSYPSKPIRLIVPFSAGGSSDLLGRIVAQKLGERLGQPIIVENRAGAGAMLGSSYVAKSEPDGYTLLLAVSSAMVFGPLTTKQPLFDPIKDFTPISLLVHHPTILIVHPSVEAKTVKELIAYAKANPGKLNYGSQGNGTTAHLMGERFNRMAGIDIVHVPYKGAAPAMVDMLGGRIQLMFDSASTSMPHIKAGKVRALALANATRFSGLPDLPTIAEAGLPGFDKSSWNGLLGPAGMPKNIVDRLSAEAVKIFSDPALRDQLRTEGIEPVGTDAASLASHMKTELQVWEPIVRSAGLYHVN